MSATSATAGHPAIRARGIKKSFGEVEVLRGVDLDVPRGSIFALLGANGAGKSTLVNILSTLLTADAGAATVGGHDLAREPHLVREVISLTGQFSAIDDGLTGKENVMLTARLRHIPTPATRADELLEQFSLTEAASRKAATYSGGMRRRLDIAMSLVGAPEVLFLDEPTTGLDPEARIEVWKTVKLLAGQGTTVLLTTQYLEEAEQLADLIAILHGGSIIQQGTLTELRRLLPPAEVVRVERQPSLEEIFLSVVAKDPAQESVQESTR